jgi:hypothetical protein
MNWLHSLNGVFGVSMVFFGRWKIFFAGTLGYSSDLDGHFEKISR